MSAFTPAFVYYTSKMLLRALEQADRIVELLLLQHAYLLQILRSDLRASIAFSIFRSNLANCDKIIDKLWTEYMMWLNS